MHKSISGANESEPQLSGLNKKILETNYSRSVSFTFILIRRWISWAYLKMNPHPNPLNIGRFPSFPLDITALGHWGVPLHIKNMATSFASSGFSANE